MFELCYDNLIQSAVAVQVQIVCAVIQMHGEKQTHQPQVMIAMQV